MFLDDINIKTYTKKRYICTVKQYKPQDLFWNKEHIYQ